MKDATKAIGLFVVGLSVSAIGYPVMHECGHSIIAVLVGAKVVEINIFPMPSILLEMVNVDDTSIVAIGLSGALLPFFISAIIKPKWFWGWYANFIVKGISFLAFIISTISTASFMIGKPLPNDDITQILTIWSGGQWFCLILSFSLVVLTFTRLIQERPLIRCIQYFGVQ